MPPLPVPRILRSRLFEPWHDFECGMTTAAVEFEPGAPRTELAAALPLMLDAPDVPVVVGEQVHGAALTWIGRDDGLIEPPDAGEVLEAPGADALATLEPDLLLAVFTADCVPIVLADRHEKAFAVVHAGREGTRHGIVCTAVDALIEAGSRVENLFAWVGPSISAPHYEVSPKMAALFRDHFGHCPGAVQGPELRHLALGLINWYELVACGLEPEHLELDARCTYSDATLFHSHRRDGAEAGRMLTFAGFLGER